MTVLNEKVLQQFAKDASVIITAGAGPCPVFARGDRRTVATHWLSRETVKQLQADGALKAVPQGFAVVSSLAKRVSNPVSKRAFSEQHRTVTDRESYTPDGVIRNIRRVETQSVLRRLSQASRAARNPKTKRGAQTVTFSAALIEAGERFARDYNRHYGSSVATQDYMASGADGGDRRGATERRYAAQIDSERVLSKARKALGPKLEKIIIEVCCHDHDLAAVERAQNWAKNSGQTVLKLALETLAEHYGTTPGMRH